MYEYFHMLKTGAEKHYEASTCRNLDRRSFEVAKIYRFRQPNIATDSITATSPSNKHLVNNNTWFVQNSLFLLTDSLFIQEFIYLSLFIYFISLFFRVNAELCSRWLFEPRFYVEKYISRLREEIRKLELMYSDHGTRKRSWERLGAWWEICLHQK